MAALEQSQTQAMHLQQVLSPQMQQSLQILQAPMMDLRQLVARELAENPVLEEDPSPLNVSLEVGEVEGDGELERQREWERALPKQPRASQEEIERHQFMLDSLTRPPTLAEAVREQVQLMSLSEKELDIAEYLIGNLNEEGFLDARLEEVAYLAKVTPLEVERTLEKIQQQVEPAGIGARNLRECLLLQLQRKGRGNSLDAAIVRKYLPLLARKKYAEIARELRVSVESVQNAARRIAQLNPSPGRDFSAEESVVVIPEVIVEQDGEDFLVRINDESFPVLRIREDYQEMMSNGAALPKETRDYLREKMRNGKAFLSAIEQRKQTVLEIAKVIVRRQAEFMRHGTAFLKPMTMSSVAEEVGVHETTVSRAVNGKYMLTPQGVFEMKYFFTSGYVTEGGEAISNESVRQAIANLIANENPEHPLSDEQIVKLLAEQDIKIARRTVAKYRDQLGILPSHLRRK